MVFNIELFLQESRKKIGRIQEIKIDYWQYDDDRAKLVITAFNENQPLGFGDYNCEPIMEFQTAVACKQLNLSFIGSEISKNQCRWAEDRLLKVGECI